MILPTPRSARLAGASLLSTVLFAGISFARAPGLSAQTPDPRADSAAAVRSAHDAQRSFELERVRRLPPTGSLGAGRCDERIGRMCLTHDEGDDWWPGPEPSTIRVERDRLLDALGLAQERAPGDGWILGQRVLYLGEAPRWADAASVAAGACRVRPDRWCLELEGLALHQLGRFVEAERAFRAALLRMDPDSARAWLDPELLLDAAGRSWLEREEKVDRERAVAWVWALADPLWLLPGNDELTEQWARRTVAEIRSDARNPYGMTWGDDLGEVLLRYGSEVGWERAFTGSLDPARAEQVTGHHDPESRPLMPPGVVLENAAAAPPAAWTPDFASPRSTYAPGYAAVILPADAQLAVFPRGERFALVGAYALPEDTSFHAGHGHVARATPRPPWDGAGPEAGLFLVPDGGSSGTAQAGAESPPAGPTDPGARSAATSGALVVDAPAGRWVASLEVLDPAARRAGRIRAGLDVPARPANVATVSDLLLTDGALEEGAPLEEAARRALPRSWVRAGESAGLAWELFGFPRGGEELAYRLTLERARPGLLGRAARALRLRRTPPSRRLEWREQGPGGPTPSLRSIELELGELEEGPWIVRLEIDRPDGRRLVAERPLELRGRR